MRVALVLLAVLLVAVPGTAAPADRSVRAPAPVSVLAADGEIGQRVAFLSRAANGGCGAVGLWKIGRPARLLGPVPCGPRTSTGRGAYGLSFGAALLWATYTGGNIREHIVWRTVRTGFPSRYGRARPVARVSHDVDERSPLLLGEGDAPWTPYAVGSTAYLVANERRESLELPTAPASLIAHGPYLTARLADGKVIVYLVGQPGEAARYDYAPGDVYAVKAHSGLVAVLRRAVLEVWQVYGRAPSTVPLPRARSYGDDHCGSVRCPLADLRLADLHGPYAVYVYGRAVHVVRWSDLRDVVVRRPATGPVHAELEATGLSYSSGRRVSFIPRSELDRLLR